MSLNSLQITEPLFERGRGEVLGPCRPLLKWPGGKRSELALISPRIPGHRRYFEPFFGGGSVYFDLISTEAHVNDLHPDLMMFYLCVKRRDPEFFTSLYDIVEDWDQASSDGRNAIYYECRDRYNAASEPSATSAADFFILRELAYGGMFRINSSGEFNVPFGRSYARNKNLRIKVNYLKSEAVAEKINHVSLSSLDFEKFLDEFNFDFKDFMFVDPPYDSSFSRYGKTDFGELDQVRLAQLLKSFKGRFMLVCKLTPLIESLYMGVGFHILQYENQYKFNIKGRFSRSTVHAMITNYVPNI